MDPTRATRPDSLKGAAGAKLAGEGDCEVRAAPVRPATAVTSRPQETRCRRFTFAAVHHDAAVTDPCWTADSLGRQTLFPPSHLPGLPSQRDATIVRESSGGHVNQRRGRVGTRSVPIGSCAIATRAIGCTIPSWSGRRRYGDGADHGLIGFETRWHALSKAQQQDQTSAKTGVSGQDAHPQRA